MADGPRPMCLRTHHFLTVEEELEPGRWRCQGRLDCSGGHEYRLVTEDDDAKAIVNKAITFALARFGVPEPSAITVWHSPGAGEPPEFTLGQAGEPAIYLTHVTYAQGAYQAGHEVFHALFTPVATHHWVHEMLASRFSLDFLSEQGQDEYRQVVIDAHQANAEVVSGRGIGQLEKRPFDQEFYARANLLSNALIELVGSERFFELRLFWATDDFQPDYWGWVEALPDGPGREIADISAGPRSR